MRHKLIYVLCAFTLTAVLVYVYNTDWYQGLKFVRAIGSLGGYGTEQYKANTTICSIDFVFVIHLLLYIVPCIKYISYKLIRDTKAKG